MPLKQKGFITFGALITLLLAMPFASAIWMKAMAEPMMYETVEKVPVSEVGVVLGAAAYSPNQVSPILQDRLDTGLLLLKLNKVDKLLLTGAKNEVEAMSNYIKKHGARENQLLHDPAGINTLASIQNISNDYRKVTIVTQRFHLPRALFYARHYGFQAIGLAADRREYAKIYNFKKREMLAISKAVIDIWLKPFMTAFIF